MAVRFVKEYNTQTEYNKSLEKLKKDFVNSGKDMVIHVSSNKDGSKNLVDVSETYRDLKYKLVRLTEGIERCKEEVKQREIDDLLDGDLYEKEKDRNIMWLRKMVCIKKYVSVLIILLKNILNFKLHLIKNNLELLKTYRNEVAEVLFEYKEDVSDFSFKSQIEGLSSIFKSLESVVEFWDYKENRELVGRLG